MHTACENVLNVKSEVSRTIVQCQSPIQRVRLTLTSGIEPLASPHALTLFNVDAVSLSMLASGPSAAGN